MSVSGDIASLTPKERLKRGVGTPEDALVGQESLPQPYRDRLPSAMARATEVSNSVQPYSESTLRLLAQGQQAPTAPKRVLWMQRAADAWASTLSGHAACRAGCAHCCHIPVAISDIEARVIGQAIGRRPQAVPNAPPTSAADAGPLPGSPAMDAGYSAPCTFLKDDRCSIYAHRPMACRTQLNMDADSLLCELAPGYTVPVPYANAMLLKGAYVLAQPAARWADIRAFFPGTME